MTAQPDQEPGSAVSTQTSLYTQAKAHSPGTGAPGLFAADNDAQCQPPQRSSLCDGKLISSLSTSAGDRIAFQDQNPSMMSSAQLATCLQLPAPMDPVLDMGHGPLQGPCATMWLQQDALQSNVLLSQGQSAQQALDPQLWSLSTQAGGLDAQSAQLQSFQTLQRDAAFLDLSTVAALQDSGFISLPMPQAGNGSSMPVILQVQGNTTLQQQQQQQPQQVYITPSGEQLVLVTNSTGNLQQQQQLLGGADASAAAAGGDGNLHMQLQQLQEAVQRLTTETAAVQRVLLSGQTSQPQGSQAPATMMNLQTPNSSPTATNPDSMGMSGHLSASVVSSASPVGSFSGHDSVSSSSWQCLDTICASNSSSPSFRLQSKSRLGSGVLAASTPAAATISPAQGSSMLRIVSGPDMPQPMTLQQPSLVSMGYTRGMQGGAAGALQQQQAQGLAGVAPGTGIVVLGNNWPAGATYVPVGTGAHHMQPGVTPGYQMGDQGSMLLGRIYGDQGMPAGPQLQHGRCYAGPGCGGGSAYMQRPFRGNKPFGTLKGRPGGAQPVPARPAAPAKPAEKGGESAAAGDAGKGPAAAPPGPMCPGPWSTVSLEDGLKQLWSGEQLQRAKGGRLFNVQQLAWHPVGEPDPCAQDMYNFQKLKRMVQKLDAVHKTRVKLIKRIHAVADHGECDLKSVYREVRCLIGEMLHDSAMQIKSLDECRVTGLVRLALVLQEALNLGPKEGACVLQAPPPVAV